MNSRSPSASPQRPCASNASSTPDSGVGAVPPEGAEAIGMLSMLLAAVVTALQNRARASRLVYQMPPILMASSLTLRTPRARHRARVPACGRPGKVRAASANVMSFSCNIVPFISRSSISTQLVRMAVDHRRQERQYQRPKTGMDVRCGIVSAVGGYGSRKRSNSSRTISLWTKSGTDGLRRAPTGNHGGGPEPTPQTCGSPSAALRRGGRCACLRSGRRSPWQSCGP